MTIDEIREFASANHRAVLATRRGDGRVQLSPVGAAVDAEGRVIISSRETAYKVRNLRRDPYAAVCVMNANFYGDWGQAEGPVEIVSLPEAMEPLVDYYRRIAGEHPDWDEYRAAMVSEQRLLIRITIERAGPSRQG